MTDPDMFSLMLGAALAFGAIAFAQMMFHRAILGRRGFFNTRRR
jgi:hypothetical protein